MNREIKFRAWDKILERMVSVHAIRFGADGRPSQIQLKSRGEWYDESLFDLNEFTGLKDKNGVEIYEGDIVRILYSDWMSKSDSDPRSLDDYLDSISHVGPVVLNPYYGWRVEDVGGMSHGEHGRVEVIGSIYENPERLK